MTMNQSIRTQILKWIVDKYAEYPDLFNIIALKYSYIILNETFVKIGDSNVTLKRIGSRALITIDFSDPYFFNKFDDYITNGER